MSDIRELLDLAQWPDLKRTEKMGWVADGLSINRPLKSEMWPALLEFSNTVPEAFVKKLYGYCNGIHGGSVFCVYGVLDQVGGGDHDHIPLDINIPNCYGFPENLDKGALIVGSSRETLLDGEAPVELLHVIHPSLGIQIVSEADPRLVIREYSEIDDWLTSELSLVANARHPR